MVNQDIDEFDQLETINNDAAASVSPNPCPKVKANTNQGSTSKPKPPKRRLQDLSYAVKELRNVSEILSHPHSTESEQDEIEVFGKYVSKTLNKLSAHDAVCAQQEIQSILTKYRLGSMRPTSVATSSVSFITDCTESSGNIEYEVEPIEIEDAGMFTIIE